MSEGEATTVPPTTEETPAETPAATSEETPATTDDQPAVTEVTEVTEDAPKEEAPKDNEEAPKEVEVEVEEAPKEEKKKKEAKKKPKASKTVDYRTSKAGWVQKQGLLFKKWKQEYMSLDEEESVLRWWKTESRSGLDAALYMKYCADVAEPKAEATTTWPDDTANRCFVVCSPFRAFYLVAESQEERDDWIQKLTAAKEKWNTDGRKVISTELISGESLKAAFDSGAADADKTLKEEGIVKEEKTEGAPADATEGETAPAEAEGAVVTVEVDVETPTTEEPPKPAEEAPKDETPAEEAPKDETPAEEAPKDETPAEEAPKDETPAEEAPKDETPAAAGGEEEVKADD